MGTSDPTFVQVMGEIVLQFDPTFDTASLEARPSAKGNYLAITATVRATSREQLDNLYRALSSHPMVKVVL
jgi:putative lipoic acid-binding regulatory protein